jgi:hypothetical protein
MAAAVAVTCCSSRSTVDDGSDQHITVVVTAMVCRPPWPSPSVTTGSRRDGIQRLSILPNSAQCHLDHAVMLANAIGLVGAVTLTPE